MVVSAVRETVARAMDGMVVSADEVRELFSIPPMTEESFLIQYTARQMSEAACQGKAEVHAQVGVNMGPCPKNCAFCSFAARNKVFLQEKVLPTEKVIKQCLAFERDGANAVYLMVTATFPLEAYLEIGRQVKSALRPETILVANVGDFEDAGAAAIRAAGFSGVYHAVRLGEGIVTGIDPAQRLRTMRAAQQAGLALGTCVEPVGPEHSVEDLVEKTLLAREMRPVYSGAARRIAIPGTGLANKGMLSEAAMAHHLAVVRLATGREVPGNCTHEPNGIGAMAGANLFWAETGSNPRDVAENTETCRGFTVARCREILREAGWDVLEGPSRMFHS